MWQNAILISILPWFRFLYIVHYYYYLLTIQHKQLIVPFFIIRINYTYIVLYFHIGQKMKILDILLNYYPFYIYIYIRIMSGENQGQANFNKYITLLAYFLRHAHTYTHHHQQQHNDLYINVNFEFIYLRKKTKQYKNPINSLSCLISFAHECLTFFFSYIARTHHPETKFFSKYHWTEIIWIFFRIHQLLLLTQTHI